MGVIEMIKNWLLTICSIGVLIAGSTSLAQDWETPRTANGKPDLQGDIYSADEIMKASDYFMEHGREFNYMHEDLIKKGVVLLENWCERTGFKMETPSGDREIRKGAWLQRLGIRDDGLYNEIKNGVITGLSIEGQAVREPA